MNKKTAKKTKAVKKNIEPNNLYLEMFLVTFTTLVAMFFGLFFGSLGLVLFFVFLVLIFFTSFNYCDKSIPLPKILEKSFRARVKKRKKGLLDFLLIKVTYWLILLFKSSEDSLQIILNRNPFGINFKAGIPAIMKKDFRVKNYLPRQVKEIYIKEYMEIHKRKQQRMVVFSVSSILSVILVVVIISVVFLFIS